MQGVFSTHSGSWRSSLLQLANCRIHLLLVTDQERYTGLTTQWDGLSVVANITDIKLNKYSLLEIMNVIHYIF